MFLSVLLVRFLLPCLVFVNGATAVAIQTRATRLYDCVQKALIGNNTASRIVGPLDNTWTNARVTSPEQSEFPVLIAYATQVAEVTPLVQCAQENHIKAIPRSGGHHFESWSSLNGTLVIDLGHVNSVTVSADRDTAVVGPGARMGTLYTKLSQHDRTFIGGVCPTVAIGGYLGTGGYGQQVRAMGMAVDHVLSAQVVLANGTTVTASQNTNPDLFFAIRGGGMYGIIVEITLQIFKLPRSANFVIDFPGNATRFQSAKTWMHWAPTTPPEFNGQINVYNNRTQVTGWCLGCSQDYLQGLLEESGLLGIPGVQPHISGNCSTDNSRLWAEGYVTTCLPDDKVGPIFASAYNVIPDPFTPVPGFPNFQFDEVPPDPNYPPAKPWPRFDIWDKDYFERKSRPLTDSELEYIIDKSGATPDSAYFWLEWPLFNVSVPPPTTSAYAWQSEAMSLLRFEINKSYPQGKDFINDLDEFLNPRIGGASYSGFIDAKISSNPWTSYWGSNVCKLVEVKKAYDPQDFFSDPFTIRAKGVPGVTC